MTALPRHLPGLDPDVVAEVDARLAGVVAEHGVEVLLAIESGSRAWGFPSPDSDYDCRFLFVRPHEHYLTCWPRRDVIETPLDAVLDVNGWDLVKAVRLLLRGNATVLEWLRSPLVYGGDADVRADFLAVADEVVDRHRIGSHYAHVGVGALEKHGADGRLKSFLYALRPAAATRWVRLRERAVPPMDLPTLLAGSEAPADVAEAAAGLVEQKARARESDAGEVADVLRAFVVDELEQGVDLFGARPTRGDEPEGRARELADAFFRRTVLSLGQRRGRTAGATG